MSLYDTKVNRWALSEQQRMNRKRPFMIPIKEKLMVMMKQFRLRMTLKSLKISFGKKRTKFKSTENKDSKDLPTKSVPEGEFQLKILTFNRDVFQRYNHYTAIIERLARGLKKRYSIEENQLLPIACTEDPKLAVLYGDEGSYAEYVKAISTGEPKDENHGTLEEAIIEVNCLVMFLGDKEANKGQLRRYESKLSYLYDQRKQRDGFLTVICVTEKGENEFEVDDKFSSEGLCFIKVRRNDHGKVVKLKSFIQSALERLLLSALENFKIDMPTREIMQGDYQKVVMEIKIHTDSLRKYSAFLETERKTETKKFHEALENFLESHKKGIHMYGIFFEELIVYVYKEYRMAKEMENEKRNLEKLYEMKIDLIFTDRLDPEPLKFCGRVLYFRDQRKRRFASFGTLGGLAVAIRSGQKRGVGISCCHVTGCAEDWFIRTNDEIIEKLGTVVERSDTWMTDIGGGEDIYCDLSLIELDDNFLKKIKHQEMYYLSFTEGKHNKAYILGTDDPRSLQESERHVYRRKPGSNSEFIEGLILGYMWWQSQITKDAKLRSLVIAKSPSQILRDDTKAPFAGKGDSGSLVFSSGFDKEGDEILYVRAMVTHGITDDVYTKDKIFLKN